MESVTRHLVQHAQQLASEIGARAMLVSAEAVHQDEELCQLLSEMDFPAILFSRTQEASGHQRVGRQVCVSVPDVHMTRAGQVKAAVLVCVARGLLQRGDRVICLAGVDGSGLVDGLLVLDLGTEPELFSLFDTVAFAGDVAPEVFERVLSLAAQLAAEGREGRPVGTLFVLGDSDRVLTHSRSMVLNPFQGHPESERNILDPILEDTIKEFAALDGAFVVRGDGVVLTAGSQLLSSSSHPRLPSGLGTRHAAAAGITASTAAVAVCISQSTGAVSVFRSGQLITDIHRQPSPSRLAG
ncbi:MAG TPA: diadenylate cyclase [Gemmataceae bacterium]|nr:diadenylate cyclase [Gemmataceae bacterium]